MERNILLTIQYDGTGFSGWQRQPGRRTVQGELERALSAVCRQQIKIDGTSRTDAGVHALGQRASFKGDLGIPVDRIPLAVNNDLAGSLGSGYACGDIRILEAVEVPADFHARFSAVGKTYRYMICSGQPDPFRRNYCYYIKGNLDAELMKKAAERIRGTHDFACFQAAGGVPRQSTVRTIYSLDIEWISQTEQHILVTGDGFLYNMVRILAGTLIEVGLGKKTVEDISDVLASKDRRLAGHTAPPQGLYLEKIYYSKDELPRKG